MLQKSNKNEKPVMIHHRYHTTEIVWRTNSTLFEVLENHFEYEATKRHQKPVKPMAIEKKPTQKSIALNRTVHAHTI